MKKRFAFFVLICIGVFFWAGSVYAGGFSFNDDAYYLGDGRGTSPNWSPNAWTTTATYGGIPQNDLDEIGSWPHIIRGYGETTADGTKLDWFTIDFENGENDEKGFSVRFGFCNPGNSYWRQSRTGRAPGIYDENAR